MLLNTPLIELKFEFAMKIKSGEIGLFSHEASIYRERIKHLEDKPAPASDDNYADENRYDKGYYYIDSDGYRHHTFDYEESIGE